MRWTVLGLLTVIVLGFAPAAARGGDDAVAAVEGLIDVETTMLDEDLRRRDQAKTRRSAAATRLAGLYRSLDAALDRDDEGRVEPAADFELLLSQLADAEGDRAEAYATEQAVLQSVRERLRRLVLLREQHAALLGREVPEPSGGLNGVWDLKMLPLEQRGVWRLSQSGAVVNGTYELDGGWSGSLQGTLVSRKVFLLRIDSKLGKIMEYEGFLAADGDMIRGSWLNYELAGADGSTGHFSAVRRADDR